MLYLLGYLLSIYVGGTLIVFVVGHIYTCFNHGTDITRDRVEIVAAFVIGWPYFIYLTLCELIIYYKKIFCIYVAGIATPFIGELIACVGNITTRFIVESIACVADGFIVKYLAGIGIIALCVAGYILLVWFV